MRRVSPPLVTVAFVQSAQVLVRSREQRHRILLSISENLHRWRVKVLKVKAVYHTLSMLSSEGRNLVAECWLPVAEIGAVQLLLNRVTVGGALSPDKCVFGAYLFWVKKIFFALFLWIYFSLRPKKCFW